MLSVSMTIEETYNFYKSVFEFLYIEPEKALIMLEVFDKIETENGEEDPYYDTLFDLKYYLSEYSLHPLTFEGLVKYHHLIDNLNDTPETKGLKLLQRLQDKTEVYICGDDNEYVVIRNF